MESITLTAILLFGALALAISSGNSGRSSNSPAVVVNTQPPSGSHSASNAVIVLFTALLFAMAIMGTLPR